jgi:rhomboid protease GluP
MDLFYRADAFSTDIVLLLRVISGKEITVEEYKLIINNVKNHFTQAGFSDIHLLGLIITAMPKKAKQYCLEEDDHFIIDLWNRQLIVYENQSPYFSELISIVEDIIHDLSYDTGINKKGYYKDDNRKVQWITLFNTLFIVINIIIYLLVHHTSILGETDFVLHRGALSWYLIKEKGEHYRILSSMFLHSDFEHLANNMLVLFFVGDNLERAVGKIKYLIIYFGSGIIAGLSSISYNMLKREFVMSIGASGAIFGIVGAMGYILLINKGRVKNTSSIQIVLFTVFSLYGGVANANIDNVAHIGGFIGGVILAFLLYGKPKRQMEAKGGYTYQSGQEED